MKTDRHILAAAIEYHGVIVTLPPPARHHTILHALFAVHKKVGRETQGFIDNTGRFLTRQEAYPIAEAAGQIIRRSHKPGMLFSEDMW